MIEINCLCCQRILFFKLRLKKPISDCRKYRFVWVFSLFTFTYVQLSKNRICTQNRSCRESATATGDFPTSPTNKNKNKKHIIKPKQQTNATVYSGINLFSVHYNFVLDVRQSYVHSLMRVISTPVPQKAKK